MPTGYTQSDQAYILPSYGLNDAQRLGALQNTNQLNEQKQQRLYEQKQREEGKNLNTISDELNFDKYRTGEQAIDNYAQGELQNIYNDALKNHVSDDPVVLEGWLQNKVQPLAKWHTITKNGYQQATQAATDFQKVYPNSDPTLVRNATLKALEDNVMSNGERANTDYINLPDFGQYLHQPNVFPNLITDTSAFDKWVQGFKPQQASESNYTNNKGHIVASSYTAGLTPFAQFQTDAEGNRVGVEPQSETLNLGNGNTLKMLPQDKIDMMPTDVKAAALAKWYKVKNQFEQAHINNGGQPITGAQDDMMQRAFLYDYIKNNNLDQSYFKQKEKEVVPKPPTININLGNTAINDVYRKVATNLSSAKQQGAGLVPLTSMDSDARELIFKSVNAGKKAGEEIPIDNIKLVLADNGDIRAVNVPIDEAGGDVVGVFTPHGLNVKANPTQKPLQKELHNPTQPINSTGKKKIEGF